MTTDTAPLLRLLRRVFFCWRGHAFMWRRDADGMRLECSRCLTVIHAERHGDLWELVPPHRSRHQR